MPEHLSRTWPQLSGHEELLLQRDASQPAPRAGDEAAIADNRVCQTVKPKCSGCDQEIVFEPSASGEPAGIWLCKTCGAVYYGDDFQDAAANAFGIVRTVGSKSNRYLGSVGGGIDARVGSVPPECVQRLVRSLNNDVREGFDCQDKQYRMAAPVTAVPLEADFKVAGEPLRMTTKDISVSGVSLIHTRFTEKPYFALDFAIAGADHVEATVEVLGVKNFGPVYEIAGKFISRVTQQLAGPS